MSRDQRVLTLTNNTFGTEYNIFNFCQIEYSIEIVNMGAGEKTQDHIGLEFRPAAPT